MTLQTLHERQIGALVTLLEHAVEVSDGLVCVDEQDQVQLGQLGPLPKAINNKARPAILPSRNSKADRR